jgi:hypothetical protein
MNRTLLAVLSGILCAGSAVAEDAPVALFDGKSLTGWQPLATSVPGSTGDWKVENGNLVCGGGGPGWLASSGIYSDYKLTLDFRGAATVNSGVFLRSQKEGQPHETGYELQIWDMQPAGFNTGSLVGTVKASPVKIKPNEWNSYEITAKGDHFVVLLNGVKVLDARDSKHSSGVIGFQCQKDQRIEFRNILLQRLPK